MVSPLTLPPHRFVPGTDPARKPLLLLHGTGGDENDLLPLDGLTESPRDNIQMITSNVGKSARHMM